jgi:hypothetical protein
MIARNNHAKAGKVKLAPSKRDFVTFLRANYKVGKKLHSEGKAILFELFCELTVEGDFTSPRVCRLTNSAHINIAIRINSAMGGKEK